MNKKDITKIVKDIQKDSQEINLLWSNIDKWEIEDFLLNSELITNIIHEMFDKINILQTKYTISDKPFLALTLSMERNLEEGKLYSLRDDIKELLKYLEK